MIPLWLYLLTIVLLLAGAASVYRRLLDLQRRRARAQREAHEREQGALVGTIAAGLAHELRNPLSTLSMNLQLLMEDWRDPVTERERRGARKIEVLLRETRQIEAVLDNFLQFAAQHKLNLEPVDLNRLADELLDFMTPEAEKLNVRLRRDFAPHLPRVEADAKFIRQAVMNLLKNALQAMLNGGDITVRTSVTPGHVRLAVLDNGPGIPPDILDKIFQLYFSTKPSGTGLGLPVTRKIVEEHRGTITVTSETGQGSIFTITLPALDERR